MKKKEKQSLIDLSVDALTKKVDEKRKELVKILLDRHASKAKNTRVMRTIRKDIAITLTYRQEKGLASS